MFFSDYVENHCRFSLAVFRSRNFISLQLLLVNTISCLLVVENFDALKDDTSNIKYALLQMIQDTCGP